MAVSPELLEILVCPACKDVPVVLVNNDTGLKCSRCRRVYPIKDDIPVMLIDEATIDGARRQGPEGGPLKILLIRLRLIGDVVLTTPGHPRAAARLPGRPPHLPGRAARRRRSSRAIRISTRSS